jgi:hypothetical protein
VAKNSSFLVFPVHHGHDEGERDCGMVVSASPDGLWRGGRKRYVVVALEGAKVEEPTKERKGVERNLCEFFPGRTVFT